MIVKIIKRIFSSIFGATALVLIGISTYENIFKYTHYDLETLLFSISVVAILCWLAAGLLSSSFPAQKQKHQCMILGSIMFFVFYCTVFINVLFISNKHGFSGYSSTITWKERLQSYSNFIPLHTIIERVSEENKTEIINYLVESFIIYIPMSFFLPLFYTKFRKLQSFVPTVLISLVVIELTQFITNYGLLDVDDIILGSVSCIFFFFLFKIKPFQWLKRKCNLE